MPCIDCIPLAQWSESFTPSAGVVSTHLKARGVDQTIQLVVHATHRDTGFGDGLNALPIGINQVGASSVIGLQVFVVETGAFAKLAVPRLQSIGRCWIGDDLINAGPNLCHLFVVTVVVSRLKGLGAKILTRVSHDTITNALGDIGPAVHHQILVGKATGL